MATLHRRRTQLRTAGRVRNRSDGSAEALLQSRPIGSRACMIAVRNSVPAAVVTGTDVTKVEPPQPRSQISSGG